MKKLFTYILISTLSALAVMPIVYANNGITEGVSDIQDEYDEEASDLKEEQFDEFIDFTEDASENMENLSDMHEQETAHQSQQHSDQMEDAYDAYEDQYPGVSPEAWELSDEYAALRSQQAQERQDLTFQQLQESIDAAQQFNTDNEDLQSQQGDEQTTLSNDQVQKILEQKNEDAAEDLENNQEMLDDWLENELDKYEGDPEKQQEIINSYEDQKSQLEDSYQDVLEDNLYEALKNTDLTDAEIQALIEAEGAAIAEQIKADEFASEYQPTIIPKPDFIPGPAIQSARQRGFLTTTFLPRIALAIIGFAGVAALIFLIVAGIRMAVIMGNEEQFSKAKDQILYALLGLIIAMLSYTIVKIVINIDFEEAPTTSIEETTE